MDGKKNLYAKVGGFGFFKIRPLMDGKCDPPLGGTTLTWI